MNDTPSPLTSVSGEASAGKRRSEGGTHATTGIAGLDAILGGGFPRNHAYLIRGRHGAGKTTLGLQFCIAGAEQDERVLYVSMCESEEDIREIARSHGWALERVALHCLDARKILDDFAPQTVFHPAEIELPKAIESLLSVIDQYSPQRLVIDSLNEIRLLAAEPRWFRRQVLALKENLAGRHCTTLLCDDQADPHQQVYSIVHGVVELEQRAPDYGPDRRQLRISKLRAQNYVSGYHDFKITTGGIRVFPRLVAAEHRCELASEIFSTGLPQLDDLFGGGLDRGTGTLLLGPSGSGKSTIAVQFVVAAADRGERTAMYIFDERIQTLLSRAKSLGLDLAGKRDQGLVDLRQIDPAELTTGEFSHIVRTAVEEQDIRLVVIDSLAGYANAMPNERLLALYLHELLSHLSQRGVTVVMVMAQHGAPGGTRHALCDVSYIADSVLLLHVFEYAGELCRAISVYKRRSGLHERTLRELRFGPDGICIGWPLRRLQGIFTGVPRYVEEGPRDIHGD